MEIFYSPLWEFGAYQRDHLALVLERSPILHVGMEETQENHQHFLVVIITWTIAVIYSNKTLSILGASFCMGATFSIFG